jgi:ABC-type Mn2+/Zn2+ transport system ATPase subunit
MNPALIAQILQALLIAEPTVVQAIHDLLVNQTGKDDAVILNQDVIDWEAVQTASKKELGL